MRRRNIRPGEGSYQQRASTPIEPARPWHLAEAGHSTKCAIPTLIRSEFIDAAGGRKLDVPDIASAKRSRRRGPSRDYGGTATPPPGTVSISQAPRPGFRGAQEDQPLKSSGEGDLRPLRRWRRKETTASSADRQPTQGVVVSDRVDLISRPPRRPSHDRPHFRAHDRRVRDRLGPLPSPSRGLFGKRTNDYIEESAQRPVP